MAEANGLPGLYVIFDSIIGGGKGAQIGELKRKLPLDYPNLDITFTYEPGGTPEADRLRQRLKFENMSAEEEMDLFVKSRSITIPQVIVPALTRGELLISDRSFTTSIAYQAFGGRNLGIQKVWDANGPVVNGVYPDILVYLKGNLDVCLRRSSIGDKPDKFDGEGRTFWDMTEKGFDKMVEFIKEISPKTRIIQINDLDGTKSIEETRLEIRKGLYPLISNHFKVEGRISKDREL